MTDDEALETLFAMANVQDGYAKKATDPGLKVIHKANAKAQREVAATIKDIRARLASAEADRDRLAAANAAPPNSGRRGCVMDDAPIFTEEDTEFGENTPILGPEYSAARRFMEGFAESFREEHLQPFTDEIVKTITDKIREKVWDDFNDYLLMDTEYNAAGAIRSMVNDTVKALLSGEKWAMERYPLAARYDAEKVRAAIAMHIPDDIAKARIADLEKQVADLNQRLEWARGR